MGLIVHNDHYSQSLKKACKLSKCQYDVYTVFQIKFGVNFSRV